MSRPSTCSCGSDAGVALLAALAVVALLASLGVGLVTLADIEVRVAAATRDGWIGRAAAMSAAELAFFHLGRAASWSAVLDGSEQAAPLGPTLVTLPADLSRRVDLGVETAAWQLRSDRDARWAANNPRWRLAFSGRLTDLLGLSALLSTAYVAAWVADDPADADGDPSRDTNDRLLVHAVAYGPGRGRREVDAAIERHPAWGTRVRVLWLRER